MKKRVKKERPYFLLAILSITILIVLLTFFVINKGSEVKKVEENLTNNQSENISVTNVIIPENVVTIGRGGRIKVVNSSS